MKLQYLAATIALASYADAFPNPHPVPQGLDLDAIAALPPPTTPTISTGVIAQIIEINTAAIIESAVQAVSTDPLTDPARKLKRQPVATFPNTTAVSTCVGGAAQPTGNGPPSTPDTPAGFAANPTYAAIASAAPVPSGYSKVFTASTGSVQAYYYMGYTLMQSYDTQSCAALCTSTDLCQSFNVLFERAPSVDPGTGTGCSNPASTILIKCVLYGGPITPQTATNVGQWRADFHVLIAGSNGYTGNRITTPPGYTTPTFLNNSAINAPLDCNNADTYLGVRLSNTGPFNPALCAAICTGVTDYNVAHPPSNGRPPQLCTFFNTYMLLKNGVPLGQHCAMYNQTWPASYAVNRGQWDLQGNAYTIADSFSASNASYAPGCVKN